MSWNWPALVNRIASDVPFIQKALNALLKQDPTSIEDIPAGAKRLTEVSSGNWQVQQYNGTSWDNIGKLKMDVDTVDSYHAAITPTANTIAVRNEQSKLEGDITGNAATASSAVTLSEALAVNKGGTGATTSAEARTNLGVPPTSHASSTTTYGVATDTNYGHVRSDGDTTKISSGEVVVKDIAVGGDISDLASNRGQIGKMKYYPSIASFDTMTSAGVYNVSFTSTTSNPPFTTSAATAGILVVFSNEGGSTPVCRQIYFVASDSTSEYYRVYMRNRNNASSAWAPWCLLTTSKSFGAGFTVNATTGVVTVNNYKGATSTLNGIAGLVPPATKGHHDQEFLRGDGVWVIPSQLERRDFLDTPTTDKWINVIHMYTSSATPVAFIAGGTLASGGTGIRVMASSPKGRQNGIFVKYDSTTDIFLTTAVTPSAASNSTDIATTKWVRNFLNTATVGTTWKQLGNRGTTGTWTITGVKANVPLFIIAVRNTISNYPRLVPFGGSGNTGFKSATTAINGLVIADGSSYNFSSNNIVVLPTSTSVSIYIQINVAFTLYAYQTQ